MLFVVHLHAHICLTHHWQISKAATFRPLRSAAHLRHCHQRSKVIGTSSEALGGIFRKEMKTKKKQLKNLYMLQSYCILGI